MLWKDIYDVRLAVASAYDKDSMTPNDSWRRKVSNMSDAQVFAIYVKLKNSNFFEEKKKKDESYHQMTIFEYYH